MNTLNFDPFPVLTTERLVLRAVRPDDRDDLFTMRSDKETMQYVSRPLAQTADEMLLLIDKMQQMVKNSEGINWMITEKGIDKLIGIAGYHRIIPHYYRAEVGYTLNRAYTGRGIAREALAAVIDYGFNVMKLNSIEAQIRPDNIASQKVIEHAGFVRNAHFKEYKYYKGQFWDALVYSRITPHK